MPPENAPPRVEIWSGRIPIIGWFAHHYWFVVAHGNCLDRWEVWQTRDNCPTSWGYLHKNLMPPARWIKRQSFACVAVWSGTDAAALIERVEASPQTYPWCDRYHYWPGPNSNTYVQWILGEWCELGPDAVGKRYARRMSANRSIP